MVSSKCIINGVDSMMNKKGFTLAEVIVSFSLISIILASMIATTMFYRDKLKEEEVISQLWDFKNTMTKTIYDDIITQGITRVENCVGITNCINLIDSNNTAHTLKIIEYNESTATNKRGAYLYYNNIKYMLPDSDLGTGYNRVCDFVGGIDIDIYEDRLYSVTINFLHKDMNKHYDISFIVTS